MPSEIKLPKLKENVEAVEVQEVLVSAGQTVEKDQPLEEARDAMLNVLEKLTTQPVTAEEVSRAKAKFLKERELQLTRSNSIGTELTDWPPTARSSVPAPVSVKAAWSSVIALRPALLRCAENSREYSRTGNNVPSTRESNRSPSASGRPTARRPRTHLDLPLFSGGFFTED